MTILDPKQFDGEPHEVASAAGAQLTVAIMDAQQALDGLYWAARGAWMSAEDYRTGKMPDGLDFKATPQGRNLDSLAEELASAYRRADTATKSAGWNPRSGLTGS